MRRITCLVTILAFMIFFPLTALGQGAAYIGPHLGIQKARDADDANYLAGATLRLKLIPSLAAEGSVGYRQETYVDEAVTVRNWPVTVTGLFYPLPIVYGGVGAGWYHTTYDYDESLEDMGIEDNTNQEFGWHLALGAELPAGPKVAITGDVRYVFLDYSFADLPDVVTDDVDADFYSVTVGLLFRL